MDKLKNDLKNSAKDIEIPNSISPEKMREKLNTLDFPDLQNSSKNKKKYLFIKRRTVGVLATAASFLLIATVALRFDWINLSFATQKNAITSEDTKATSKSNSSNSDENTSNNSKKAKTSSGLSEFYYTTTYDDIKKKVKTAWSDSMAVSDEIAYSANARQSMQESAKMATGTDMDMTDTGSSRSEDSYSSTNLQVEGVDEGDFIKTDGIYFYILNKNNQIRIVEAKTLKEVCTISNEIDKNEVRYSEMYVADNRLILAGNVYHSSLKKQKEDVYYMDNGSQTILVIYDLSNQKNPKLIGTVYQDGNYRTSRKIGDYIYLFSDYSYYPNNGVVYTENSFARKQSSAEHSITDDSKIIPTVNQKEIPADHIYISKKITNCNYLVISSINLKNPSKIIDEKSLMQFGDDFHITKESIYVLQTDWESNHVKTNIIRFSFKDGKISPIDVASLDGQLTDTFAINESNSYLRVLLTDWSSDFSTQTNSVYVLNDKMKVVGKIQNLAQGETIYSARFMGDIGYFVTYRNTDPLFSVDFSNPKNPKIIGELKITGFSEYLHFYGKNKLLGLGRETDPNTGEFLGIKLSIFDIRNPKNVKEEKKLVLKGIDECEALYDYKAVLVDSNKNLIGFFVKNYENGVYNYNYLLFSYTEEEGFIKKLDYSFTEDTYAYSSTIRGIYIDSIFYIVRDCEVTSFDMEHNFKKQNGVILN